MTTQSTPGAQILDRLDIEAPEIISLVAAGQAIIVEVRPVGSPRILHWGASMGSLAEEDLRAAASAGLAPLATNGIDAGVQIGVLPEASSGWTGTPGLQGHRADGGWSPRFQSAGHHVELLPDGTQRLVVSLIDPDVAVSVEVIIEMLSSGLVRIRSSVRNDRSDVYWLEALTMALPVPDRADEVMDLAGRWAKERVPQRRPFTVGTHLREGRHGRTGADAATVLVAGESGFGLESGEAWAIHLAFSGNHRVLAERSYSRERLVAGGELLLPGEMPLSQGKSYTSPWLYAASGDGLDEVAARFHDHVRSRPHHPRTVRPVVMNVWEAVYFDHDLDRLRRLAELGAGIGVERFVLDDGWFGDRRDDRAGLGDWVVSEQMWGEGKLRSLVDHVHSLGMDFGIWFEPEMVNLDSDLARAHPEWILQVPGRLPVPARHQQVLNLAVPEAFAHVRDQIIEVVRTYDVAFIKWDHNRDLVDAGSTVTGRPGVHAQTLAAYTLMDEVRAACPGLEIESCSSGGARVDLEVLERTDRVWASDCIDAHERQEIQRWTLQLLPPELIGSHIGAARAHTTGRVLDLSFRAITALFGSLGIEWDLTAASEEELVELSRWVGHYKDLRGLIHTGRVVRRELAGGDLLLTGAVSPDRRSAVFSWALMSRHVTWPLDRVVLPGLDPELRYRVTAVSPTGPRGDESDRVYPHWWWDSIELPGAVLTTVGIQGPALDVDHAALVRVEVV